MNGWQRAWSVVVAGAKAVGAGVKTVDPDIVRHVAQLPLMAPGLFVPRDAPVRHRRDDGYPPVVFVHGLGGQRGNFLYLSGFLALNGRRRRYAIQFDRNTSIEARADALVAFVNEVREVTGAEEVDLVAHSLGGIVARLALAELDFARHIGTVITLGAPHGGTFSARVANTELTRALRPNSAAIARLGPPPPGVRVVSLWSRGDLLVLPPESAVWPGSESIELSPFTHYSYLLEPRGWRAVARVLDGRPIPDPAVAHA